VKLRLTKDMRIVIADVACAWDPLVEICEVEKKAKYQELAADLAKQWQGYRVTCLPVVVGDLGIVVNLMKCLRDIGVWEEKDLVRLTASIQR
jgi:hypothetical protein